MYFENLPVGAKIKLDDELIYLKESGEYDFNIEHGEHKISILCDLNFWRCIPKFILYKKDKHCDNYVSFARVKYDINSLYYVLYFSTDSKANSGKIGLCFEKNNFYNYSGGFCSKLEIALTKFKKVKLRKVQKRYFQRSKLLTFFLLNFLFQTIIHGLFFAVVFSSFCYCVTYPKEIISIRAGIPNKFYIVPFIIISLVIFIIWLLNIIRLIKELKGEGKVYK